MGLTPIVPFEPIHVEELPEGQEWVGQVKWDGVRILTYHEGIKTRLFNRKLNERTAHYPELINTTKYCSAESIILDGEVIALQDGKPSFYKVMKRDGIKNLAHVPSLLNQIPILYMVFDVLFINGKWVTSYSLQERQNILSEILSPHEHIHPVDNFTDLNGLYEGIKIQNMEGIVVKDLTRSYLINGKDGRWRKKKFYRDLIAVVGGVTFQDKIVNSLLLGQYDDEGHLWYIGHAGTGRLSQKDWQIATQRIFPIIQPTMPFANQPSRLKHVAWVKPCIAVKVKYSEWTTRHSLRHPSIQSFVDMPSEKFTNF